MKRIVPFVIIGGGIAALIGIAIFYAVAVAPWKSSSSEVVSLTTVSRTKAGVWEVERQELQEILDNLDVFASQARIVPSVHQGKPVGFRLMSIKVGSFYEQLGVQNDDIVTHINEHEVFPPGEADEIRHLLRTATEVNVQILRDGTPAMLQYTVVP